MCRALTGNYIDSCLILMLFSVYCKKHVLMGNIAWTVAHVKHPETEISARFPYDKPCHLQHTKYNPRKAKRTIQLLLWERVLHYERYYHNRDLYSQDKSMIFEHTNSGKCILKFCILYCYNQVIPKTRRRKTKCISFSQTTPNKKLIYCKSVSKFNTSFAMKFFECCQEVGNSVDSEQGLHLLNTVWICIMSLILIVIPPIHIIYTTIKSYG